MAGEFSEAQQQDVKSGNLSWHLQQDIPLSGQRPTLTSQNTCTRPEQSMRDLKVSLVAPIHFIASPIPLLGIIVPKRCLRKAGSSKHLTESLVLSYSFQSGMFTTTDFLNNKLTEGREANAASHHLHLVIFRFFSAEWLL